MMDPKLWQDYLRLLEQLTRTIHQLTGIEQSKTRAASQGNLEERSEERRVGKECL